MQPKIDDYFFWEDGSGKTNRKEEAKTSNTTNPTFILWRSNNFTEASMKQKPLTVTLHIGGKQVDKLTDEQCERMTKRLSEVMSRYYSVHPEEYRRIKS